MFITVDSRSKKKKKKKRYSHLKIDLFLSALHLTRDILQSQFHHTQYYILILVFHLQGQPPCFSSIVKAKTYDTIHYLHCGYHGNTRKAGLIHWRRWGGSSRGKGKGVCLFWVKYGKGKEDEDRTEKVKNRRLRGHNNEVGICTIIRFICAWGLLKNALTCSDADETR